MTVTKNHLIFLALYTAVVVLTTWYFVKPSAITDTGLTPDQLKQLDSLNTQIGVLEFQQRQKDSLINKYKQEIVVLDQKVDSTKTQISQIRKEYEY